MLVRAFGKTGGAVAVLGGYGFDVLNGEDGSDIEIQSLTAMASRAAEMNGRH